MQGKKLPKQLADKSLHPLEDVELLRHIVEEDANAIFITNHAGIYQYANKKSIKLLGYSLDELRKLAIKDIIDPEELPDNPILINKVIDGEEVVSRRRLITKNGQILQTEISSKKLPNGYLLGIVKDLTESVKIENALQESEQRYRNLVEVAPIGIVVHQAGLIVWANKNAARIIGETNESKVIGTSAISFVDPSSRDLAIERIRNLMASGKEAPLVEELFIKKDGTLIPVQVAARKITYDSQPAILTIFQDISEIKKTENALIDLELNYQNLFKNAPVGIYRSSLKGTFLMVNQALASMLGYDSVEEVLKLNMSRDVYATPSEREKLIKHYVETGSVIDLEIKWRKKDGSIIWISMNAIAIKNVKGDVIHFEGYIRDISKRKGIEQELIATKEKYYSLFENSPISLWEVDFSMVLDILKRLSKNEINTLEKNPENNFPVVISCMTAIRLVHANKATFKLLDINSKEDFLVKGPGFFTRQSAIDFCRSIIQLYKGKDSGVIETTFKTGDDRPIDILLNWHIDPEYKTTWKKVLLSLIDITERKEAENAYKTSQEKFKNIIEHSTIMYYTHTAEHVLTYVSPQSWEFLGCSPEDALVNWTTFATDNPINEQGFELTQKAIETGEKQKPYELELISRNGKIIKVEVNETPLTENGKTVAIIGSLTDITERKIAEQKLKESEEKFSNAFHFSGTGMVLLNPLGKVTDLNDKFCKMLGLSKSALLNQSLEKIIYRLDQPIFKKNKESVLTKRRNVAHQELRFNGSEGNIIWCIVSLSLVRSVDLSPMYFIIQVQNITPLKELQIQLSEQNTKLKATSNDLIRKNNQLEEFNQIVSHNLRAPVGNIHSLLSAFREARNEAEKSKFFDYLGKSSKALSETLNELNEVLRIRQSINIPTETVKFEILLARTISLYQAQITNLHAKIEADFMELPKINYSKIYLESIFMNLISNSLKYCRPDKKPKIRIKTFKDGSNKILQIIDNGLGIDLQKHGKNLFKLYKTFHRHEESRGVGLFIVKNQVEAMGGEIQVSSKPGKGTTFTIILTT